MREYQVRYITINQIDYFASARVIIIGIIPKLNSNFSLLAI